MVGLSAGSADSSSWRSLAEGLLAGVGRQLAEEEVEFVAEGQGQQPTEAVFRRGGIPRDPKLARLPLTLVEDQEPLSPAWIG